MNLVLLTIFFKVYLTFQTCLLASIEAKMCQRYK